DTQRYDTAEPDTRPTDSRIPVPDTRPPDTGLVDTPPDTRPDIDRPSGPQIRVTPRNQVDFGTLVIGASSTQSVVIRNYGDETLELKGVELRSMPSKGFMVKGPAPPPTLSPGQSVTYNVTFDPVQQARFENDRDYRFAVHFESPDGFRPPRFQGSVELTVAGNTHSLQKRFTVRDRNQYWITFELDGQNGDVTKVDREQ
ncbi:MAG: choice-of-anchor D domain-containing protein, partial [Bradymonadaceae bacterium]